MRQKFLHFKFCIYSGVFWAEGQSLSFKLMIAQWTAKQLCIAHGLVQWGIWVEMKLIGTHHQQNKMLKNRSIGSEVHLVYFTSEYEPNCTYRSSLWVIWPIWSSNLSITARTCHHLLTNEWKMEFDLYFYESRSRWPNLWFANIGHPYGWYDPYKVQIHQLQHERATIYSLT